jgi:hypothetical protein
MNHLKEPNKTMQRILDKYKFFSSRCNWSKGRLELNLNTTYPPKIKDDTQKYSAKLLEDDSKSRCNKYPAYLFVILDDGICSELISMNDSPIIKLLKICRYMHISCAICAQTVCGNIKELKRLIGDVILNLYLTYDDLANIIKTAPTSHEINEVLPLLRTENEST